MPCCTSCRRAVAAVHSAYAGASPARGADPGGEPRERETPPPQNVPPNERRPREATGGDEVNTRGARSLPILPSADEDRTQARCDECGKHLHKPSSVSRGTGPVCAARVVDLEGVGS
jgi:hypothetical protein